MLVGVLVDVDPTGGSVDGERARLDPVGCRLMGDDVDHVVVEDEVLAAVTHWDELGLARVGVE